MNEQAVLKVNFRLSEESRQAKFVDHGAMLDEKQTVDLDMSQATPEQRAAVVRYNGISMTILWQSYSDMPFDVEQPGIEDVAERCDQLVAAKRSRRHSELVERLGKQTHELSNAIDERSYHPHRLSNTRLDETVRAEMQSHEIDLRGYDVLYAAYAEMEPQFLREQEQRAAEKSERDRTEAEQDKAKKLAERNERIEWAQSHGSDHLKRGLNAGHDCGRMYWRERAAVEYPGYVIDIEDDAESKSRACPSIDALDERDAVLAAHPDIQAEIVWLTASPSDRKTTRDEAEYGDEFEPCEAVKVDAGMYPHYLYRVM